MNIAICDDLSEERAVIAGLNGIETAEQIRAFDERTPIVFATTTEDFALQNYRVFDYNYGTGSGYNLFFYPQTVSSACGYFRR